MRRAFVTATMTLAVYVLSGSSVAADGAAVWTAGTPATICRELDENYCDLSLKMYVRGLSDGISLPFFLGNHPQLKDIDPVVWWHCIQESSASIDQLDAMFRKSLQDHPEDWSMSAALFFVRNVVTQLCEQLPGNPEPPEPNAQSDERMK